jgi:hypothetical protein
MWMLGQPTKLRANLSGFAQNEKGTLIALISFCFFLTLVLVIILVDVGGFYIAKRQLISAEESILSGSIQSLDASRYYQSGLDQVTGRVPLDCTQAFLKMEAALAITSVNGIPLYFDGWNCQSDALYLSAHIWVKPIIPLGLFANLIVSSQDGEKISATVGEASTAIS